jgi:hypothetical protein
MVKPVDFKPMIECNQETETQTPPCSPYGVHSPAEQFPNTLSIVQGLKHVRPHFFHNCSDLVLIEPPEMSALAVRNIQINLVELFVALWSSSAYVDVIVSLCNLRVASGP